MDALGANFVDVLLQPPDERTMPSKSIHELVESNGSRSGLDWKLCESVHARMSKHGYVFARWSEARPGSWPSTHWPPVEEAS